MPKLNYEVPTQVKFYDADDDRWFGGIAFGERIICGECGTAILIADIYEMAPNLDFPVLDYDFWVNISEIIMEE
jgi:hypothetical protein